MKIFVWERIDHCSDNYHEEGGVVAIAESLDRAKVIANKEGCVFSEDEEPDFIGDVTATEEKVFIMPAAGCC